jgi:hypothetical protein
VLIHLSLSSYLANRFRNLQHVVVHSLSLLHDKERHGILIVRLKLIVEEGQEKYLQLFKIKNTTAFDHQHVAFKEI